MKKVLLSAIVALTFATAAAPDPLTDAVAASNSAGLQAQADLSGLGGVGKVLGLLIGMISFPAALVGETLN